MQSSSIVKHRKIWKLFLPHFLHQNQFHCHYLLLLTMTIEWNNKRILYIDNKFDLAKWVEMRAIKITEEWPTIKSILLIFTCILFATIRENWEQTQIKSSLSPKSFIMSLLFWKSINWNFSSMNIPGEE